MRRTAAALALLVALLLVGRAVYGWTWNATIARDIAARDARIYEATGVVLPAQAASTYGTNDALLEAEAVVGAAFLIAAVALFSVRQRTSAEGRSVA